MTQNRISLNSHGFERPHVVIIGAGFGGVWAAKELAKAPVHVTVFDKNNYHTFLPLLYQVAAAELAPEQIGYPVRAILSKLENVDFVLAEVTAVDLNAQTISTRETQIDYDYLILATGSVSRFFGIEGAAEYAFPLKTMDDGVALRNHILRCFEEAAFEKDETRRRHLLTFVVVGGGPTGVEYAGALSELIHGPLAKDYPSLDVNEASIVLVEAVDSLLTSMPEHLRHYAVKQLESREVDVRLETAVTAVTPSSVSFKDGSIIDTATVVWTAGVGGEALAANAGFKTLKNGQVPVLPTLQLDGYPTVYAIGDIAALREKDNPLPMVAPVATQQGTHAAKNLQRHLAGEALQPFVYNDRGSMATIGRNTAVAHIRGFELTGFVAWVIWLAVHLTNLIGFRNRLTVLINWAWSYLFFDRVIRLILPSAKERELIPPKAAVSVESETVDTAV